MEKGYSAHSQQLFYRSLALRIVNYTTKYNEELKENRETIKRLKASFYEMSGETDCRLCDICSCIIYTNPSNIHEHIFENCDVYVCNGCIPGIALYKTKRVDGESDDEHIETSEDYTVYIGVCPGPRYCEKGHKLMLDTDGKYITVSRDQLHDRDEEFDWNGSYSSGEIDIDWDGWYSTE